MKIRTLIYSIKEHVNIFKKIFIIRTFVVNM